MITITNLMDCEANLGGVQAVVFDMDDTLYPEKDYVRSGYRAVAATFPQVEHMAEKLWAAFEAKQPAIDAVLESEGLSAFKEKALQIYRNHTPEIALYPGAEALLKRLRETKKLGLITDGRPEGQRAKLQSLGLAGYFDHIIVTDELGGVEFRKPNQAAFRLMQQALGVPFSQMVYIGDNPKKDFIAPEALGMQAIWFANPDGLYSARS